MHASPCMRMYDSPGSVNIRAWYISPSMTRLQPSVVFARTCWPQQTLALARRRAKMPPMLRLPMVRCAAHSATDTCAGQYEIF